MNRRHFFGAAAGAVATAPVAAKAAVSRFGRQIAGTAVPKAAGLAGNLNQLFSSAPDAPAPSPYTETYTKEPHDPRYSIMREACRLLERDYEDKRWRASLRTSAQSLDYDIECLRSVAPYRKVQMQNERLIAQRDASRSAYELIGEIRRSPVEKAANLLGSFWNRAASMVKEET